MCFYKFTLSAQTSNGNFLVDINGNCELTSRACNGSGTSDILAETTVVTSAQPVVIENLPVLNQVLQSTVSLTPNKRQRSQDSEGSDFNPGTEEEVGS